MFGRKRDIQAKRRHHRSRRFCGLSVKDGLQFLSSLILPLMLGVFTVVITFEQQKIARQQRLEDKIESQLQRDLQWDIAIKNQEDQSKAASDRYQDEVLVAYIKEIGDFLKDNNGSLTCDSLIHILARVKTLNAIGQLDGSRQIRIIRFLYETGQLTNTNKFGALDISTAELTDIDFRTFTPSKEIRQLSLAGVYLRNYTFDGMYFFNVNLLFARLNNVNFSSALLDNVTFLSARLNNVNFSSAWLNDINFSSAWLDNVNFSSAGLNNVRFSSARLTNVNLSSARFSKVLGISHFDHANMAHTIFVKCVCVMVDFIGANLKGSSFHGAKLSDANFSLANLQNADFTNTTITDSQLHSALSIRDAILPNGTLGRGRNLVKNGDANCNISLVDHWKVQNGNITVMPSKEDRGECQFTLQSIATGGIMSQQIDLVGIWDPYFWAGSTVDLKANMSSGVSIELSVKTRNGIVLDKKLANSTENKIIMELQTDMHELEVVVKFNAHNNKYNNDNSWCDNIELFVDYNRHLL